MLSTHASIFVMFKFLSSSKVFLVKIAMSGKTILPACGSKGFYARNCLLLTNEFSIFFFFFSIFFCFSFVVISSIESPLSNHELNYTTFYFRTVSIML
jgi:hypothetical protein